jgi:hypothetical protein
VSGAVVLQRAALFFVRVLLTRDIMPYILSLKSVERSVGKKVSKSRDLSRHAGAIAPPPPKAVLSQTWASALKKRPPLFFNAANEVLHRMRVKRSSNSSLLRNIQ